MGKVWAGVAGDLFAFWGKIVCAWCAELETLLGFANDAGALQASGGELQEGVQGSFSVYPA